MQAYKLMRIRKDGSLGSLFINRERVYKIGEWMEAEFLPTKGFAERAGWHCCLSQNAPHLKQQLSNGEKRVWVSVEIEDYTEYKRPESQGGAWLLANKMKILSIL